MKIVFLDIDGVLNRQRKASAFSGKQELQPDGQDEVIEEDRVALLSGLVHKTGARLVLHSGWRFYFDGNGKPTHPAAEKLIRILEKHDLSFFSFTPDLSDETIRKERMFSLVKAKEILLWLQGQAVESYVVLDDLELHDETIDAHQVRPDGSVGLTEHDVEKATAVLNGGEADMSDVQKENNRLEHIRREERLSHTAAYEQEELFSGDGWLGKPVKTVGELIPLFTEHERIHLLDLGCGVGRTCIPFVQAFPDKCMADGVDILDIAIERLEKNSRKFGVEGRICGHVCALEDYPIPREGYDLILAVSALEHVDSEETFFNKLEEIRAGIRERGAVCLMVNTQIEERDPVTGELLEVQFEVNLSSEVLTERLEEIFSGWRILKETEKRQTWQTERRNGTVWLETNVVTFVATRC